MRTWLALAIVLATGCSYRIENLSDERAPEVRRARARIPARAFCHSELARMMWFKNALTEDSWASAPTGAKESGNQVTVEARPESFEARESFSNLVRESELFDDVVYCASPVPIRKGTPDVLLSIRQTSGPLPDPDTDGRISATVLSLGALFPLVFPTYFLYLADDPLTMAFELRCEGADGEVLARYETHPKVRVKTQACAPLTEKTLAAGSAARSHAEKLLFGKLLADEDALDRIRAAVGGARAERAPERPRPPEPLPAATGAVHVLVIGVNDYRDAKIPRLRFAEQDARSVFGFFATEKRSPTIPERVHLLLGKDATRAGILQAIREHLASKATRREDVAILYFAGHGFADAQDTYLAGEDAQLASLPETAISSSALRDYWDKIPAARKVLIADACRSGGLEGIRGIGGVTLAPREQSATLTIAATGPNEVSTEDATLGQGVFTIALLRGLRGEADADGDGRVRGDELRAFLMAEVPSLAARARGKQTPAIEGSPGALSVFLTR